MPEHALYYEDLPPGRCFVSQRHTLDQAQIIAFASQFDPQPFHLDARAADSTVFKGLAASGWHTASVSMRLVVDSELGRVAGGLVGMQVDKMRWPTPTRAGDTLQVCVEVAERKVSSSQPGFGVVKLHWTTRRQDDVVVMQAENWVWVPRRPG